MVLKLVDHSIMLPRGMVKDLFIKVGEFIFLVDFVVLETDVMMSFEKKKTNYPCSTIPCYL